MALVLPTVDGEDSTNVSNLSRSTGAVVCYSDRRFKNDDDARAQFPHLDAIGRIIALAAASEAPDSPLAGDGVDTEPGNLPPTVAAASIKARIAAGHWRPVGYADLSDMHNLISDLHLIGIPTPPPGPDRPWRVYTAHPTGIRHLCGPHTCGELQVDADITQWWWSSLQNPGGVDLDKNVFREDAFPTLSPPPPPPPPKETEMIQTYLTADHRVGIAAETSTGEVFHIEQQGPSGVAGQNADWWRNSDGTPHWLSLGVPGK